MIYNGTISGNNVFYLGEADYDEEPGYPTDVHQKYCERIEDGAKIYMADWFDEPVDHENEEPDLVTEIGTLRVGIDAHGTVTIMQDIDEKKLNSRNLPLRISEWVVSSMDWNALCSYIIDWCNRELQDMRRYIARGFKYYGNDAESEAAEAATVYADMLLANDVINHNISTKTVSEDELRTMVRMSINEDYGGILGCFGTDNWTNEDRTKMDSIISSVLTEAKAKFDEDMPD